MRPWVSPFAEIALPEQIWRNEGPPRVRVRFAGALALVCFRAVAVLGLREVCAWTPLRRQTARYETRNGPGLVAVSHWAAWGPVIPHASTRPDRKQPIIFGSDGLSQVPLAPPMRPRSDRPPSPGNWLSRTRGLVLVLDRSCVSYCIALSKAIR